jgi:hypothetical protein
MEANLAKLKVAVDLVREVLRNTIVPGHSDVYSALFCAGQDIDRATKLLQAGGTTNDKTRQRTPGEAA